MCYACLHSHSMYSLLDGMPSPDKMIKRCKDLGLSSLALTDHGSLGGIIELQKAGKKYGVKTISGCELYICKQDPSIKTPENNKRYHLTVLAKNQDGMKSLMKLVSESNRPDYFYRKPRLDLKNIANFTKNGNLICLSGCLAGELSENLFTDLKQACLYGADMYRLNDVRKLLKPNWKDVAYEIIETYQKVFGKENYFIELQTENMVVQNVVVECLRECSSALNIQSASTLDAHYLTKEDADDHKILLYSQMRTSAEQIESLRQQGSDVMAFFYLNTFYIYSYDEMKEKYTEEEIEGTLQIADMIQPYSLGRAPCLPKYHLENKTSDEYIKELCVESAKIKFKDFDKKKKQKYWERLQRELSVIEDAKLADYFLIVWDVCKFVDANNAPRGKGRGSGAGSLVNYLLNVTQIDPLEYGLYFERFFNTSRSIPPSFDVGHIKFIEWLSENYNQITKEKIDDARNIICDTIRGNILKYGSKLNNKFLKEEREWIDKNNPKMWLYIHNICKGHYDKENEVVDEIKHENKNIGTLVESITKGTIEFENPNNSHIIDALRMYCKLEIDKPVKINEGHISLPDIDTDIGVEFREKVVEHLIQKWGEDKVSQMITFGKLMGKAALKEVFRAQPDLVKHLQKVKAQKEGKDPNDISITPFDLCNEITFFIPDEASIIDEIQQAKEETENSEYGILNWCLDNVDEIKEYYKWYKPLFDQAIRLEGTKKSQSKHAAGVVIADRPIEELVPMTYDAKNKTRIVGFEMGSAEQCGCVKFDFLGVNALDKIWYAQDLINKCI